jgi:hypothetical protein
LPRFSGTFSVKKYSTVLFPYPQVTAKWLSKGFKRGLDARRKHFGTLNQLGGARYFYIVTYALNVSL